MSGFASRVRFPRCGRGGPEVGEPFRVRSVSAIVRSAPFPTPCLEIADTSENAGSADFDFLNDLEVTYGTISIFDPTRGPMYTGTFDVVMGGVLLLDARPFAVERGVGSVLFGTLSDPDFDGMMWVDDILVEADAVPTPVESASWGRIKTLWSVGS